LNREAWIKNLNKYSMLAHIAVSLLLYFFIECVSRHSLSDTIGFIRKGPLVFLYNAFLIYITSCIVFLVRRRVFMRSLLVAFWAGLGIINGVILSYRVTPFTGPDLHLIMDAWKLINVYLSVPMVLLVFAGIVIVIILLVFLWLKAPKYQGKLSYKVNVPVFVMLCVSLWGCTQLALKYRVLSNYFGNIAFAYEDYGFPYCLATTVFNTGINCPQGYSKEYIEKILSTEGDSTEEEDMEKKPNIIFLQLESFFDPVQVEDLKLSQDPIPNFRRLFKEYSSGYFRVPSVGAGTANTEFEVITGMNLRYFGPGEYPYKTILKKTTCESMGYDLKGLGYTAHAIHNNEANFYERAQIFSQLGFDTFISEEYMNIIEETPTGWAKDDILVEQIMDALQSTEGQDYIYTISVQGHGKYPEEPVLTDPEIKVSGIEDEGKRNAFEYYVNQIYEMDAFVQRLIETLEEYGEDTVLVIYGDHLPTMGLKVEDLKNRYLFQTEYVMWNNMGLPKKSENLASYQIGAEVLKQLDIKTGTIFKYHQNRRNTKDYMVDLEELQYDILYGEQYAYGEITPFKPTDLAMGVKPITIDRVSIDEEDKEYLYVIGANFTKYSKVLVEEDIVETQWIDENTLRVKQADIEKGNGIRVAQTAADSERTILSQTDLYMWRNKKD
jgi:phosphoglycerol transferase MdoB-like AlkP superfamily enzyme